MRVDLPAPFAPTNPMIPGSTDTVRSVNAVTRPPYVLVSDSVASSVTTTRVGSRPSSGDRLRPRRSPDPRPCATLGGGREMNRW